MLIGALGVALFMRLPAFMASYDGGAKTILLSGDPSLIAQAQPLLAKDFTIAGRLNLRGGATASDLRAHRKAAAIVALAKDAAGLQVTVYSKDPSTLELPTMRHDLLPLNVSVTTNLDARKVASLLTVRMTVKPVSSKFGTAAQADQARIMGYILLVLLYVLIVLNSQLILTSVAEEKTSRIAELLVASVNPSSLLAGKVIASATLALLQMVLWVGVGFLFGGERSSGGELQRLNDVAQLSWQTISVGAIASFAMFFLLGYFEMATLFAAIGSLVNHTEDLGSLGAPLFIPVVAAFFIAVSALEVPDAVIVIAASFIPLLSPFVMFARVIVSDVPVWQVALCIFLNLATIWAIAIVGGKIYRVGMLLYGRTPRLWQIWQVLRV